MWCGAFCRLVVFRRRALTPTAVGAAQLYEVTVPQSGGNTTSTFALLHVWGTAFEKGEAQGLLYGDRLMPFLSDVWSYLEQQVEQGVTSFVTLPKWLQKLIADVGLDVALDATEWASKAYTGAYIYDELKGLCSVVADPSCYRTAVRVHMLAGLTQGHCSLFGAWGKAAANGHTLQLRALDWNMDGPFRNYPSVTVYHASAANENSFALVGMVGFIGGLTGMSDKQLGISEIGVSYPDATFGSQSRFGLPFIFLLRDILQLRLSAVCFRSRLTGGRGSVVLLTRRFDQTVDDAISRMADTQRTCDLILAVGDGNVSDVDPFVCLFVFKHNRSTQLGEVRGFQYSDSVLNVFDDRNMRPTNDTWHFRIPEMVYWGMDWCVAAVVARAPSSV